MAQDEPDIPAAVRLVGELLRERTGLHLRPRTLSVLGELVQRRAAELGIDAAAYAARLDRGPDVTEIDRLAAELTVGETHFFRGPPQFEALRRSIVPKLVERRQEQRKLWALSAGCATGEEAYSLAIVMREVAPAGFGVAVTGVDLNPRFLQKAERARYSPWSLRDVPESVRRRYFRVEGDTYHLGEELRELVRFRHHSLAQAPLGEAGISGIDLIVCQNVLYYLEPEARPRVVASLVDALAPGGVLLLGPVDHPGTEVPGCRSLPVGEVVAFERMGSPSIPPPPTTRPRPPALRPVTVPPPPPPPAPTLADAFARADAGDLGGALSLLGEVLEDAPEEPRAHLLEGLLLVELGRLEAALDAFRRCVYLDASMLLAHAGAAVAGMRLGRPELAERHMARLRALSGGHNTPIEGWEGMTVGRLLRLFREGAPSAARPVEVPVR
jgi:chemotaxis protein methyltransferase CheR